MRIIHLIAFVVMVIPLSYSQSTNYVEKTFTYLKEGNIGQAFEQLKNGASTNDVFSQYYIACCYEKGIGTVKNLETAFVYYRRAAERGFAPAMYELSRFYEKGIFVPINENKSKEWMNKAIKRQQYANLPDIMLAFLEGQNLLSDRTNDSQDIAYVEKKGISQTPPTPQTSAQPLSNISDSYSAPVIIEREQEARTQTRGSDVDIDIPFTGLVNDNVFALVIANENYQDIAKVDNAINDGVVLAKYLQHTIGIPERHIHLVQDATLNNIKRELNYLKQIASAYNGETSFIIYYAGHGIPDEKTKKAFLMPVDGWGGDVSTCISLDELYSTLNGLSAKKVLVFMDACFSGSSRSEDMLYAARGVRIKPKESVPLGNCVVISSTQDDETAYSHPEQNHGLFTYFLLKKLKESKGDIALGELMDYVKSNVSRNSLILNQKSQTPSVTYAPEVGESWRNWSIGCE